MIKLTALEELQSIYSDLYKDVHGFRPRHLSSEQWKNEDLISKWIDDLSLELEAQLKDLKSEEAQAIKTFESKIELLMNAGAKTRETAIRWLHESNGTHGDADYLCFTFGIPYGYLSK
jgi:hypothetical protein